MLSSHSRVRKFDTPTGGGLADMLIFDAAATSWNLIRDFNQADGDPIQPSKAVYRTAA
jgi:hypothetical protein